MRIGYEIEMGLWEARLPRGREMLLKAARGPVVIVKDERESLLLEAFAAWVLDSQHLLESLGPLSQEYRDENGEVLAGARVAIALNQARKVSRAKGS